MFITIRSKRLITLVMLTAYTVALFCAASENNKEKAVSASVTAKVSHMLVIDPGHGGDDGGAVSPNGLMESPINFDISKKIDLLCSFLGTEHIMTRYTEKIDYPDSADTIAKRKVSDQKSRVALVNSTENAILVSIHQNIYPHSAPKGSQVLYGKEPGSDTLAEIMQENLTLSLYPENRRVAAPIDSSIYLLKNVTCPAILIECGFLSNPEEETLLGSEEYRLKLAAIITASYRQYISQTGDVLES